MIKQKTWISIEGVAAELGLSTRQARRIISVVPYTKFGKKFLWIARQIKKIVKRRTRENKAKANKNHRAKMGERKR